MAHRLATFAGTNGAFPVGTPVMDSHGTLYGVTTAGGPGNISKSAGTVFKVAHGSSTPVVVAPFKFTNGQSPLGGLIIDGQGDLFGTTGGNLAGTVDGTIFEIPSGTKTIVTLANFDGENGSTPRGRLLMDDNGNLFGTTSAGGASGDGTVFELPAGTGAITTLATFNGANGSAPFAGVTMDAAGNLFGTTSTGGAGGLGTVFEIAKGSGALATLASFNGPDGSMPEGEVLIDSAGNLFGTTAFGGASGGGTVFKLSAGTNTLTTLAQFNGGNGSWLQSNLVMDSAGNLIGTTSTGGTSGNGTVFTIPRTGGAITSIAAFSSVAGGASNPSGGLLMDASGNLFGTTRSGGPTGDGTVFELVNQASGGTIGQPALSASIASSTLPTTVVPGESVRSTVTVDLTNQSPKAIRGRFIVNVDAGGTIVANVAVTLTLGAQHTAAVAVQVPKIVANLAGGTYTLTAQAVDQVGNTSTVASGLPLLVETPAVELTPVIGNVTPASIAPGKSGSVVVTVTNNGNIDALGPLVIDLGVVPAAGGQTTTLAHTVRNGRLNTGHSVIVRLRFGVPLTLATGSYLPTISISANGTVATATGPTPFAVG